MAGPQHCLLESRDADEGYAQAQSSLARYQYRSRAHRVPPPLPLVFRAQLQHRAVGCRLQREQP